MPGLFRRDPDTPGPEPRASAAEVGHQSLTTELLDWALAALEAVLRTPQVQGLTALKRPQQSIVEAYKHLDRLYPYTEEVTRQAVLWEAENRDTGVPREWNLDSDGDDGTPGEGLVGDWRRSDGDDPPLHQDWKPVRP